MASTDGSNRLLWSLFGASLVLNSLYAAVVGVLVPTLLAEADEGAKETNLAVVLTVSSLLTVVVSPLVGVLSDRTTSRWGRRAPWIVGGALASAVALVASGGARTVLAVGLGWVVVQPLLNVVQAALDAVLPDRVPDAQRARASARYGVGAALGLGVGAVVGAVLVGVPQLLTLVLAAALLVTMVGFVLRHPETPRARTRAVPLRQAWRSVNLRLVFVGRFVMVLGSQLVLGYLLYVVMEFTDRDPEHAAALVPVLVGVHLVALAIGGLAAIRWAGHRRVATVVVATLVVVVGLLVPVGWPNLGGLFGYAVVAGLGRGAYLTADVALMLDVLPSTGDHGRDFGILGLATVLPQTLAPALSGALLYLSGDRYVVIFVAAAVAALASIPFVSRVRVPTDEVRAPVPLVS